MFLDSSSHHVAYKSEQLRIPATGATQLLTIVFFSALCIFPSTAAGQQVWDLPTQGPPTTNVLVQGTGFDPLTAVDVYFDTTKLTSTTTDKNGSFGNGVITATGATFTRLQVPANALPGQHTITVQERVGQKSAEKSFLVQTDWAQFGFNEQHTSFNPYENVLNPGIVGNLVVGWKYNTESNVQTAPAVANGMAYVAANPGLYAFNAATGSVLWKISIQGIFSSPAVVNGVVYAGSVDLSGTYVDAINASTGALIWKSPTGGPPTGVGTATVANGAVYIGCLDNNVYAFDAGTGALLWKYATMGQVYSSPAVANGVVYINSADNFVYALNARTGALLWNRNLFGPSGSSPSVADGIVYVESDYRYYQLLALDAATGDVLWTYLTGTSSSAAVANGVVYVTGGSDYLYALDAKTGTLLWQFSIIGGNSPTVADGVAYVGDENGSVYAVTADTGELRWKYATGRLAGPSAAVANGMVFIGSGDDNVYAFHLPGQ